jgi:hypothetical protein
MISRGKYETKGESNFFSPYNSMVPKAANDRKKIIMLEMIFRPKMARMPANISNKGQNIHTKFQKSHDIAPVLFNSNTPPANKTNNPKTGLPPRQYRGRFASSPKIFTWASLLFAVSLIKN